MCGIFGARRSLAPLPHYQSSAGSIINTSGFKFVTKDNLVAEPSLRQQLVKTGGRLIKRTRYY